MVCGCAVALDHVAAGYGDHKSLNFDPHVEGFFVIRKAFRARWATQGGPQHGVPRCIVGLRNHLARTCDLHDRGAHALTTS
jgi:hypothetical protein